MVAHRGLDRTRRINDWKSRDFQEAEHAAILYIFGLFFYMLYVEFQMKISS